jgi:C4-dicarboxylate-specific signal transduction histidine kinase
MEINLTLEKRVREELKKRQKQQHLLIQKSKLESMGELSAGIAHEINQPLGGISMGLDNILFRMSNDGISEDYLKNKINALFKDIDRIRQIINHVRVFSRDQGAPVNEIVELNAIVRSALSMVTMQYYNQNIQLNLDLSNEKCFTVGNKYRIEQVILNLLSNAKYAVDERSRNLPNKNTFAKSITIRSWNENDRVNLEIEDNGTGISKKNLANIFDPFFTTKDVETGTGLGLSISYGIIKDLKGDINVESQVNKFTKVKVILPKY